MDKRTLGTDNTKLRKMILDKFGTVRKFALEVGLTESMISHILHQRKKLHYWNAELFAKKLGIPEYDVYMYLYKKED